MPVTGVHEGRSRCSRCSDLSVHDAPIPLFTNGRFPQFDVVFIAYGAIVLLSRFLSGKTSTASWEVAITVALGTAWALQPVRWPGQKAALTFASIVAFVVLVAMLLAVRQLFLLLLSVTFVTYGLRGLVTNRITLAGRVGPGREHTGTAAYFQSALCIACGAAGATLAFMFP
jgi:hypothetical protein